MFSTFDSEGPPLKRFEGAEVHHSCWGFHMGLFFVPNIFAAETLDPVNNGNTITFADC